MVDAVDSKSTGSDTVRVRVSLPAPNPASDQTARRLSAGVARLAGQFLVILLGLYLAYLAALFVEQRAMLFPGVHIPVAAAPPARPGLEVLRLPIPGGVTEVLFLPAVAPAARQPVLIFAHGNGEVTDFWVDGLEGFRARGVGVALVEYPGYGRTVGSPSETAIRAAMLAAYDRLAADPRVEPSQILGFGQSLGGGAIGLLARERPLRALILQSTFPALDLFAYQYGAPAWLLRDRFDTLTTLRTFPGPVLVIHGRHDRLIPWSEAERLAKAAKQGQFRLYDCGHLCWAPERLPFWQDAELLLRRAGVIGG